MRILISSRNTLIPAGLQQILAETGHTILAHYYQSPEQLIAKSILERAELVILDKRDDETFTYADIHYLKERMPRLRILMISGPEHVELMRRCHQSEIEGYVSYDCGAEEMEQAVETISRGKRFFCQKTLSLLLPQQENRPQAAGAAAHLTDRELEIARLVAEGFTNKQIGDHLCISPHTVHTHRKSFMKKLGISSAREVALFVLSLE